MVADARQYNFSGIIEAFFTQKPLTGPNSALLRGMVEARAGEMLLHPDVRYMPAFKILDLLSSMVEASHLLDAEPQLRASEARALLQQQLEEHSPRLRQFLLDAALERARYEPMMILGNTVLGHRADLTLRKRWHAMRVAHQSLHPLPPSLLIVVDNAVERTITAANFAHYREGPLMQYFAEMLELARRMATENAEPDALTSALAEGQILWKRYALKPQRYRSKKPPPANLETGFSSRPTMH